MAYYMKFRYKDQIVPWEKCKATTLNGAKREAGRVYGIAYRKVLLVIAEADNENGPFREISSRKNMPKAKWS